MRITISGFCISVVLVLIFISCHKRDTHQEMINLLKQTKSVYNNPDNYYASDAQAKYYDSLIRSTSSAQDKMVYTYSLGRALIALGREEEAIHLITP